MQCEKKKQSRIEKQNKTKQQQQEEGKKHIAH
jgi:hypothetical protein